METWAFISERSHIPITLRFWMNMCCLSHLCVALSPILMLLLMNQQMASWAFGSNKETDLLVSKCPRIGVLLKSKCQGRGVSKMPLMRCQCWYNCMWTKDFPLKGNIMDSHLRGSVKNDKSSVSWNLILVINLETWEFISGITHAPITLGFG